MTVYLGRITSKKYQKFFKEHDKAMKKKVRIIKHGWLEPCGNGKNKNGKANKTQEEKVS